LTQTATRMASHTLNPALRAEKAPAPRSATGDKPYEEYDCE